MMEPHVQRAALLAEAHARPFHPVSTPRQFIHFAFTTDAAQADADRAALNEYCQLRGVSGPGTSLKHFRVEFGRVGLVWEQHSEFTTYTWDLDPQDPEASARPRCEWMTGLPQPGPLLVLADLQLVQKSEEDVAALFSANSLAMSFMDGGSALAATDFRVDGEGFVRIVVADISLSPGRAGALVQRLLELETYRVFALLSLPEAQRLTPEIAIIEGELLEIASAMPALQGLEGNHELLQRLIALAARLEAATTASMYRFAAGRAYAEIVDGRLTALGEEGCAGRSTFASFMSRRLAPAMRTCSTMEDRQANLSRKIARAAQLLRTRVDIELEHQNRDLLASLNTRTRLQLRLQQTVEILSVAATTYYVVSLVADLLRGLKHGGVPLDTEVVTAVAVPVVMAAVVAAFVLLRGKPAVRPGLLARRRRAGIGEDDSQSSAG